MKDRERNSFAGESLSRRRFIGLGAAALALPVLSRIPAFALNAPAGPLPPDRGLSFFNTHTGESVSAEYCRDGCLVPASLDEINHILRDHRTGEVRDIDVQLLDLLHTLSQKACPGRTFHVISGYRSPTTNASLRANGSGVAARSLHLDGRAIDIRVPGLALRELYRGAVALKSGGVGIYPASDFVHVDVGRVRTW